MTDNPFEMGFVEPESDDCVNDDDLTPARKGSGITYHEAVEQGSDEWHALRCGKLTASEMKLILTPTLKIASNDKERQHLYELLAQRITGYVEPQYIGDAMLRGYDDEITARDIYSEKIAPVKEMGFITNDEFGFTLGYSPDGLVGDDGLIEVKSRMQKYQTETLVSHVLEDTIPKDYVLQCQSALLITKRQWLDFISYCGGMHMAVIRVYPDAVMHSAILEAATAFEERLNAALAKYKEAISGKHRLFPTERVIEQEMFVG